jgi:hypothetical protein
MSITVNQARKPIRRRAKQAPSPTFLDPAAIKERFYGLTLSGHCLDPVFRNGDKMVIDKEGQLHVGCYAVFYHRPELVPPGAIPMQLKRLVTAMPPVTLPYREHPESEVQFIIAVEQLNPPKRWVVKCTNLLAVHRCIGRAGDPEVERQLEVEGWRS